MGNPFKLHNYFQVFKALYSFASGKYKTQHTLTLEGIDQPLGRMSLGW